MFVHTLSIVEKFIPWGLSIKKNSISNAASGTRAKKTLHVHLPRSLAALLSNYIFGYHPICLLTNRGYTTFKVFRHRNFHYIYLLEQF